LCTTVTLRHPRARSQRQTVGCVRGLGGWGEHSKQSATSCVACCTLPLPVLQTTQHCSLLVNPSCAWCRGSWRRVAGSAAGTSAANSSIHGLPRSRCGKQPEPCQHRLADFTADTRLQGATGHAHMELVHNLAHTLPHACAHRWRLCRV
jgi:hypothetical protein